MTKLTSFTSPESLIVLPCPKTCHLIPTSVPDLKAAKALASPANPTWSGGPASLATEILHAVCLYSTHEGCVSALNADQGIIISGIESEVMYMPHALSPLQIDAAWAVP